MASSKSVAGNINHKTMAKKLVFFDIDGTIDRTPFEDMNALLDEYRAMGFVFGINTNRPLSESVGFYDSLQMRGPIITEDGALFKADRESAPEVFSSDLIAINDVVVEILGGTVDAGELMDFEFVHSDDKAVLARPNEGCVVLVTKARKFTTSVHTRCGGRISPAFSKQILESIVSGLGDEANKVTLGIDALGGKIIGSNLTTNRLWTLFEICKKHYNSYDILMVSDNEPELRTSGQVTFAAVKNADERYRRRCSIAADVSGTEGLRQTLEQFTKKEI